MEKFIVSSLIAITLLAGCAPKGEGKTEKFKYPDIKQAYCGAQIDFRMCKCAFHGEYCKELGLSQSAANSKVQSGYGYWVGKQVEAFAKQCVAAGGISRNKDTCVYCKEGYVVSNESCQGKANIKSEPEGSLTADCKIDQAEYDSDWKKYSDIDDVIPFEERSYEAKQAYTAGELMVAKMVEGFGLDRDVELERQLRTELETYRDALVKNLKTNLLKSFWRLSYVTFTTIKSGSGVAESYQKLLEEGISVETIGAGLKVMQSMVPSNSSLTIDTSDITGKVKSASLNTALEAVDSLGDPVKVVTALFSEASNAALPSADITDEEVAILQKQYIKKGTLDAAIAQSRAREADYESRIAQIEKDVGQLRQEVSSWETKEKDRVANGLVESCEKMKK